MHYIHVQVCNNLNQCFCNIGFTGSSCGDEVQVPTGTPAPPGSGRYY